MRGPAQQRGIALIVALLLLILISLVGLAAVRGTIMQQKMASNQYDREVAFQNSEAALRAAAQVVVADPKAAFIRNCAPLGGAACLADPFSDPQRPANAIQAVKGGSAAGQFTVSGIATGQPEFVVENMGTFQDPATIGLNQTANSTQYGGSGPGQSYTFYRITARSGDPTKTGGRAVVTLQTLIKQ